MLMNQILLQLASSSRSDALSTVHSRPETLTCALANDAGASPRPATGGNGGDGGLNPPRLPNTDAAASDEQNRSASD